jgi:dCMP deaminase
MNSKWKKRFLTLAKFVAEWSKDPKAKVGAVLVNRSGVPIALGFNGFPSGVEDSLRRLKDKETKLDMIVHAEQNVLLIAGPGSEGADLYVWGKPVCSKCAGPIIQAKVGRIIAFDPKKMEGKSKWKLTGIRAVKMFREAHVKVKLLAA